MTRIVFVQPDGSEITVEGQAGTTVMQAAVSNGIDGIVAECGGSATCATCHVYVDAADLPLLNEIGPIEDDMLMETASPRRDNSRLGCQILLSDAIPALRVHVPDRQY